MPWTGWENCIGKNLEGLGAGVLFVCCCCCCCFAGAYVASLTTKLVNRPHQNSHFSRCVLCSLLHMQYHPWNDFKTLFFMKIGLESADGRKESRALSGLRETRLWFQIQKWPRLLWWVLFVYQWFFKIFKITIKLYFSKQSFPSILI